MRESSKDSPRTFVTGSEARPSHDAVVRFSFKSLKRFGPRQLTSQFSWRLDEGRWSPFQAVEGLELPVAGLASGRHALAVRSRDPIGTLTRQGRSSPSRCCRFHCRGGLGSNPWWWRSAPVFCACWRFLHRRTGELSVANAALVKIHGEQEERVAARTRELSKTNEDLLREVTDRKLAEKSLGEVTSLQKEILDCANFSIISTDVNGIIVVFNHCAEKLLGHSASEVAGKASLLIVHDPVELRRRAEELSVELGGTSTPVSMFWSRKPALGCRMSGSGATAARMVPGFP